MRIERIDVFEGPNVYCLRPTVRMLLDLEALDGVESRSRPGFDDRLLRTLPGLADHHCSRGRPGGFVERLGEGTWFGHVVEHAALELLARAGLPVRYGRTRRHGGSVFAVVFEHAGVGSARVAAEQAVALVEDLLAGRDEGAAARAEAVAEAVRGEALGPSTRAIWEEAARRGIPVRRIGRGNLLELGHGVHRRRIWATVGDATSAAAVDIACDKPATKALLAEAGLPVPEGRVVSDEDEAVRAWFQLGGRVVVKPACGNQGRGVSVGLSGEADVRRAFRMARAEAGAEEPVVVERHVAGRSFRVLVAGGRAVAAAERVPPSVTGDGRSTVRELVARLNEDPRRGEGHGLPLTRVTLDAISLDCLRRQGFAPDSVPVRGRTVRLRESANLSTGGTARDATDELHPEVARAAERAARAVGLDPAGVDVVAPSIARPLAETGGAVIEVNASPGLRMHLDPDEGRPRPVAARILDALMGPSDGRVPIVAVTGTNGKTTTARLIAHLLESEGFTVGLAATGGVVVAGEEICRGDTTGPASARMVLGDPRVEAAVLETARGGMLRAGLGFDRADVAVVTNIAEDHLGQDGVETLDDLVWVKSLVADATGRHGWLVLNADDRRAAGIARGRKRRIAWFTSSPPDRAMALRGDLLVYPATGGLWARMGGADTFLGRFSDIPLTWNGTLPHQVENVAAAAAAALALGLPAHRLAPALASFDGAANPGRFQAQEVRGVRVILDYGHNVPAWSRALPAARAMARGAVLGVIGVPGDRRDDLIRECGRVAARWCDRVVIKEDGDRRGRRAGDVAALLLDGLLAGGMARDRARIVLDERRALRAALREARAGDVVIAFYEHLAPLVEIVRALGASEPRLLARSGAPE